MKKQKEKICWECKEPIKDGERSIHMGHFHLTCWFKDEVGRTDNKDSN